MLVESHGDLYVHLDRQLQSFRWAISLFTWHCCQFGDIDVVLFGWGSRSFMELNRIKSDDTIVSHSQLPTLQDDEPKMQINIQCDYR